MTTTNPAFGTWLAHQLARRDMSQADFARKSGLGSGQINHWISGRRRPKAESCAAIADVLRIDPIDVQRAAGLLDDPGEDTPEIRAILRKARRMDMLPYRYRVLSVLLDDWLSEDEARRRPA